MNLRSAGLIILIPVVALVGIVLMWVAFLPLAAHAASPISSSQSAQEPSIAISYTVGLERSGCATETQLVAPGGSDVSFCLAIENNGTVTYTNHVISRTVTYTDLVTERYTISLVLAPGSVVTLTDHVLTSTLGIPPRFNIQNLTAPARSQVLVTSSNATVDATAAASVTVDVASIALTKTVGMQEGACASSRELISPVGTPVYYCFTMRNTGSVTAAVNLLDDSLFALPPFVLPLDVDETVVLTQLQPVAGLFIVTPTANVTNTATVFATASGVPISDTASATVRLQQEAIHLPVAWSRSAFAAARALWQAQGLDSYRYTLRVSCFCPPGTEGVVTVENDAVVSVVDPDTGAPLPESEWFFVETIDELFTILLRAEFGSAELIEAQFDATYGYPTHLFIDYIVEAIDDEYLYVVEDFVPIISVEPARP